MKIGVFHPNRIPMSAHNYIDNVIRELKKRHVECFMFDEEEPMPLDVDIYWDPRAMGGGAPYKKFAMIEKPLVVTVHGASSFALPAKEHFSNIISALIAQYFKLSHLYNWRKFRDRCDAYIAVSSYGKWEIAKHLRLDESKITPIWHGADLDVFKPDDTRKCDHPYFLHVSQYQPLKNIKRVIDAYTRISVVNKPALVLVLPRYPKSASVPEGVVLIRESKNHSELAVLYQEALGLVYCSLRESFGMPIVEAMACGCPVITSSSTGCQEVAGDAAILVNPRSVDEITTAMERLLSDESLQNSLRKKGLERVQQFTWKRSAKKHLKVFECAINKGSNS